MPLEALKGLNMDSILNSVKAMLGITPDYDPFDNELIMHINSVFMVLHQLGVGPSERFEIEGADEEWSDFLKGGTKLGLVKSYMYLKVRQLFDPPTSGGALEAIDRQIKEFEWRLNVEVETPSLQGE